MTEKEREIYNLIRLRYNGKIRIEWDEDDGEEYLAIVDAVKVFTEENPYDAEVYWKGLKNQLWKEGCEWVRTIPSMPLYDDRWGEECLTEVATASQMYRIVQSISSPKAELLKQWMADTATYREEEMGAPELLIYRGLRELAEATRLHPDLREGALNALKNFGKELAALDEIPDWKKCDRLCSYLGIPQAIPQPSLFDEIDE